MAREISESDVKLNAPQSPIQCKIGEVTLSVGENFFYGGTYWHILEVTDVRVPSVYDESGVPLIKCKALEDCERFRRAHEILLPADRVAELFELTRSLDQFTLIAD